MIFISLKGLRWRVSPGTVNGNEPKAYQLFPNSLPHPTTTPSCGSYWMGLIIRNFITRLFEILNEYSFNFFNMREFWYDQNDHILSYLERSNNELFFHSSPWFCSNSNELLLSQRFCISSYFGSFSICYVWYLILCPFVYC